MFISNLNELDGEGRSDHREDENRREDEQDQVVRLLVARGRRRVLDLGLLDEADDELGRREAQENRKPNRRARDARNRRTRKLEGKAQEERVESDDRRADEHEDGHAVERRVVLLRLDQGKRRNHEIGDDEAENDPRLGQLRAQVRETDADASASLDEVRTTTETALGAGLERTTLEFSSLERRTKCHLFILGADPPCLPFWIHRPRNFKRHFGARQT